MMKLPWTTAHEEEAQHWAKRHFSDDCSEYASRVALLVSDALGASLSELEPHRLLRSHKAFSELAEVELLLAIEREFGSSIADDEAAAMTTLARIVSWVRSHRAV